MRLALWVTRAWSSGEVGGTDLDRAVARALPDVDHIAGDLDRLALWHSVGEAALLVALPAPGDIVGLPATSAAATGAATASGECVFVPALGGMLVPQLTRYGADVLPDMASTRPQASAGARTHTARSLDVGIRVDWTAYDSSPVPQHRVEALDATEAERTLRCLVTDTIAELEALGGQPFEHRAGREMADAAAGGPWGLPAGLPPSAERAIRMAGTLSRVAAVALDTPDDALSATTSARRHAVLRRLLRTAERALADATNAGCAAMAGWVPTR